MAHIETTQSEAARPEKDPEFVLRTLKRSLLERDYELKSARAAGTRVTSDFKRLLAIAADLEQRLADQERKTLQLHTLHAKAQNEADSKVMALQEEIWVEQKKVALAQEQLSGEQRLIDELKVELHKAHHVKDHLRHSVASQQESWESVVSGLYGAIQDLTSYNTRLEDEAVQYRETSIEAENAYSEKLDSLQRSNDRNNAEIRNKSTKLDEISKELQIAKQHLSQFTTEPTAQFKLISDLYAAYVASEQKYNVLQQREEACNEQQKRAELTVREFSDEMSRLRGMAAEYEKAYDKAERELSSLKKNARKAPSWAASSGDDVEVLKRELEVYKLNLADAEKSQLFATLARNTDHFDQFLSLASNEAVMLTFTSGDHSLSETRRLRRELKVVQDEVDFWRTRRSEAGIEPGRSDMGRSTMPDKDIEIASLKDELQRKGEQLNVLAQEMRVKDASSRKFSALYETTRESAKKLTEHRDQLLENLKKQVEESMTDASTMSELRTTNSTLAEELERLRSETTGTGDVQSVSHDAAFHATVHATTNLVTLPSSEYDALTDEREGLTKEVRDIKLEKTRLELAHAETLTKMAVQESELSSLKRRCENELRAHQASVEAIAELRRQLDSETSSVNDLKADEAMWKRRVETVRENSMRREKDFLDSINLMTKERENAEEWRESFYERLEASLQSRNLNNPVDLDSVMKHLRTENDLLKKQLHLAKRERESLTMILDSSNSDIARLEREMEKRPSRTEDVEGVVWRWKYTQNRELLSIAVENSTYLRKELIDAKAENEIVCAELAQAAQRREILQGRVNDLESEKDHLEVEKTTLRAQLEESNRRFDNNRQRQEIEELKAAMAAAEAKTREDKRKAKDFYSKQAAEKLAVRMRARDAELAGVVEENGKVREDLERQLAAAQSLQNDLKDALQNRENDLNGQIQAVQRTAAAAQKANESLVQHHKQELARYERQMAELNVELHDTKEKVRRLEAAAAASSRTSAEPTVHPVLRLAPTVTPSESSGPTLSLRPERPVRPIAQTAPLPSSSKSSVIVAPQAHPPTLIQWVTPQLRLPDVPVQAVSPQSHDVGGTAVITPSTSSISSLVASVHPPDGSSSSRVDDGSMPSTSSGSSDSSGHKRARNDGESGPFELKRRREASPSSDVTSSTAAARNTLGAVGSATLLRKRADSVSTGVPGGLHAEIPAVRVTEDRGFQGDRAVGSSGGHQSSAVHEAQSVGMEERPVISESFDPAGQVAEIGPDGAAEPEMEYEEIQNEPYVDYDTDESSQDVQPSYDPVSPVAPLSEQHAREIVFPDDALDMVRADEVAPSVEFEPVRAGPSVDSSMDRDEPPTSSRHLRISSPHSDRAPGRISVLQAGPSSSSLFPPRTPGLLFSGYDAGEDAYGVVPSTPKLMLPRRENENDVMPQVPSFFFPGLNAETIDDVTASQVPPTPFQPDVEFFDQRSGDASEDSESSFPNADDAVEVVPSGSRRDYQIEEVEIAADDAQPAEIDASPFAVEYPVSPGPASNDPAVPSPGSADSVEAVETFENPQIVHHSGIQGVVPGRSPQSGTVPGRRRGPRRRAGVPSASTRRSSPAAASSSPRMSLNSGASSSAASSSSNTLFSSGQAASRERRPISAPSADATQSRRLSLAARSVGRGLVGRGPRSRGPRRPRPGHQ